VGYLPTALWVSEVRGGSGFSYKPEFHGKNRSTGQASGMVEMG